MAKNTMDEYQAFQRCKEAGVKITEKNIHRGSYSLRTWAAIDCLIHYHGYRLVNEDGRVGL